MEADRRVSIFYGLVYDGVEGFEALGLHDPEIDALLANPLREKRRRYRNAIPFPGGFSCAREAPRFYLDEAAAEWIVCQTIPARLTRTGLYR